MNRLIILLTSLLSLCSIATKAQCPVDDSKIQITNYCPNQYAEYLVNDANAANNYRWYTTTGSVLGLSREFISEKKLAAGSGAVSYDYSVEYNVKAGSPIQSALASPTQTTGFSTNFDATMDFELQYITVAAVLYQTDKTYNIQVKIGTNVSKSFDVKAGMSGVTLVSGQVYLVRIPVFLQIAKGTGQALEIVTPTGGTAVDGLKWVDTGTGAFPYTHEALKVYQTTQTIWGSAVWPAVFDWEIAVKCPKRRVTAVQETNATKCCIPVSSAPILESSLGEDVQLPFTTTLTAYGDDANYFKWYKDGVAIAGAEGIGYSTITASTLGRYTVREVAKLSDVTKFSCYASETIELRKKLLYLVPDTAICLGESIQLNNSTEPVLVEWTPTTGLDDPSSSNPVATPTVTTTYIATSYASTANLITNPNFDLGNTGFDLAASGLVYGSNNVGQGGYTIGSNPNPYNPGYFAVMGDHTTGTGQMMIIDVNPSTLYVYQTTVPVIAGKKYAFSAWMANISKTFYNPSRLRFIIDGKSLGKIKLDSTSNKWEQFYALWTATATKDIVIKIINENMDGGGNDMAFDDVSFSPVATSTSDQVTITVNDCFTVDAGKTVHVCNGDSTRLNPTTTGIITEWTPHTGLDKPYSMYPWAKPAATTLYTATAFRQGNNLITNPGFESGNTGFTVSGITYSATSVSPGQYSVGTNPNTLNSSSFSSITDHTSGTGKMLIADADPSTKYIYQTDVAVKKGTSYAFSVWAVNISKKLTNPGKLQFYVDGVALGGFTLDSGSVWRRFYSLWTATVDKTVTLQIINTNTVSKGNDLAIDDVAFTPISVSRTDTVSVIVDNCVPPIDGQKISLCETTLGTKKGVIADLKLWNDSITEFTPGNIVTWYSNATYSTKITTLTNVTVSDGQKMYVRVSNAAGTRTADSVVDFTVRSLPTIGYTLVSSPCAGSAAFALSAKPTGGTFSGTNISATGTYTPPSIATTADKVTYTVTVNGCENKKDTTITTNGAPTTTLETTKLTYCGTSSDVDLKVTAVSGATYAWTKGGVAETATTNILSGAAKGTYSVTLKKNNCSFTLSDITVTQYNLPTYQIKGTAAYCKGKTPTATSIELTGVSPWVVAYKVGTTTKKITVTSSPANLDTLEGTYQLDSMRDAHCSAVKISGAGASASITINPLPTITFTDPKAVCLNTADVDLSKNTTLVGGSFTGSNVTTAGVFSPKKAGSNEFTFSYTDATTTCSSTIKKTITVLALPKPSISPTSLELCETKDGSVTAAATSTETGATPCTFVWTGTGASYLLSNTAENNSFKGTTAGKYRLLLTATDKNTCVDTTSIAVTVFKKPTASIVAAKTKVCSYDAAFAVTPTTTPLSDANATASFTAWPVASAVSSAGTFTPADILAGTNIIVFRYSYKYSNTTTCDADSVKTQVVVNKRPVVSLSAPQYTACIDAQKIALAISPTLDGDGSLTGTGVSGTDFVPSVAKDGSHILTYYYKNPTTGCDNTDTTKIIVNKKPEIAFDAAPANICLKAGAVQLKSNITGVSYSGTGITASGLFNPKTAGVGSHTIEMYYKDPVTGCDSTISHNITVHETAKPSVITPVSDVLPLDLTAYVAPDLSATGTQIKWYDNAFTFLQTGNKYKTGKKTEGSFVYFATQTDPTYNCESDSVEVILNLTNCPAQAPIATDVDHCYDNGASAINLSATAKDGGKLGWFNASMATAASLILDNSTSYPATDKTVGDYPYYVAEWSASKSCWGSTKKVYLHIHSNPEPKIEFTSKVCYPFNQVDQLLAITLTPGGGTASGDGVVLDNGIYKFKPSWKGTSSSSSEISYLVTNEFNCSTTVKHTVAVQYTPAPSTTDVVWMNRFLSTLPDLTATGTGAGLLEWWTSIDTTGTTNANPYKTGITSTEIKKYIYYASELQNCCRSQLSTAVVNIVDCPTPAPTTSNITVCENAASIPSLTATGNNIKWYDVASGGTATTGNSFSHGKSKPGEYHYWVSQTQTDATTNAACEGPRSEVVLTINAKPDIKITGSQKDICFNATPITLKATSSHTLNTAAFSGDVNVEANATAKLDPASKANQNWTASVLFSATDDKNCSHDTSFTINIHYIAPPTGASPVTGLVKPFATAAPALSATGNALKWYSAANKTGLEGTNTPFQPKDDNTNPLTKDYYVSQTDAANQCESEALTITMKIVKCPVQAPVPSINPSRCVYNSKSKLTVTCSSLLFGNRIGAPSYRWYADQNLKTTKPSTDSTYTPDELLTGINEFWVTEYDNSNNCESPAAKVQVEVLKTEAPDTLLIGSICEGKSNPIFSYNDASGSFLWYYNGTMSLDTIGATRVGSTKVYTPSTTSPGSHQFLAVKVENGCRSKVRAVSYFIHTNPAAPVVTNAWSCYGKAFNPLLATTDSATFSINWYNNLGTKVSSDKSYLVNNLAEGSHNFTATQTSQFGCEGASTTATYEVRHTPVTPSVDSKAICVNDAFPTFVCTNIETGATLQWLDNAGTSTATSFTPNNYTGRNIQLTQTLNQCVSTMSQTTYTVNTLPAAPRFDSVGMCQFDTKLTEPIHVKNTNFVSIDWADNTNMTPVIANGPTFTPSPLPSVSTLYYATIKDANGCVSPYGKVRLKVTSKPAKPIMISAKSFCEYEDLQPISATPTSGGSILWTQNKKAIQAAGTFTPNKNQLTLGSSTYFVARETNNGCVGDADSVSYTLRPKPSTPQISNYVFCWGDPSPKLKTSTSAIDNTFWKDSTSNNTEFNDSVYAPTNYVQGVTYHYGVYSVKNNCWSDTTAFTVKVSEKPHPTIVGDSTVCYNMVPGKFYLRNTLPDYARLKWQITGQRPIDSINAIVRSVQWNNKAGIDTLIVQEISKDGCVGIDSMIINVAKPAIPSYKWDLPGFGFKVRFLNTTPADTLKDGKTIIPMVNNFVWDFGREENDIMKQSYSEYLKHTPIDQVYRYGPWTVTLNVVNEEYGCKAKFEDDIFVDIQKGLYIPTAFAPGSTSPELSIFRPKGFNLESYEMTIYDQWGNILWTSDKIINNQPMEGWDGTYQGQPMKSDVYIWRIRATFLDGREWEGSSSNPDNEAKKYGNVVLIR